ncbi:MAG: zinc ribbon domain-containing protein [Opitutales bacterium]|nr:zinc ribbon domain-containing protein [Opitutales bacterium]
MPIYEYKCKKCGNLFEHFAKNFADAPKKCPKCSSKSVEKQFSAFTAAESQSGSCHCKGERRHESGHCCCGGRCHCH